MAGINHQMADLLLEIEAELRQLGWWQEQPPDSAALGSTVPFCADTLPFNLWLQWVFIPRMKTMIEASFPMPERCEIYPYAEEFCRRHLADTEALLALIGRADELINSAANKNNGAVIRH